MMSDSTMATVHKSSAPTGEVMDPTWLIGPNTPIVADLSDSSTMVGVFKGKAPGVNYLLLVNKSLVTKTVIVTLKGNYRNNVFLAPSVVGYNGDTTYTAASSSNYNPTTDRTLFGLFLDGGEGRLVMLRRSSRTDYDGDRKADLSVRTTGGNWKIDYSANAFGAIDFNGTGYGGSSDMPCPADYDGDGLSDLAVLTSTGTWQIDFASNGFNGWDASFTGHGGGTPVPGDYDYDGKADLAINTTGGEWKFDFAEGGFNPTGWDDTVSGYSGFVTQNNGAYGATAGDFDGDGRSDISGTNGSTQWKIDCVSNGFLGWQVTRSFSSMTFQPAAADYDGDGKTDIAVYNSSKNWLIDYAANGFTAWDVTVNTGQAFNSSRAVPGDYDGDAKADISLKTNSGSWLIDYAANGYGSWDATYSGFGNSSSQALFQAESEPPAPALQPALRVSPNPFARGTTLEFTLPSPDRVHAAIFDVSGREVARVVDGTLPGGITNVSWNGMDASGHPCRNGVYFVRVRSQQLNVIKKLVLVVR